MQGDDLTRLIVRISLKDRAAFDVLYSKTSAKLFGVCLRVLNNRSDAEEALQEVYVKLWEKADRFSISDQSPMSWMIAIARNHAIDRLRQRRRPTAELSEAFEIADPTPGPEVLAMQTHERARIDACLAELDADKASAVQGAYLNGDSYAELAARHGVPMNTMRTWLRRSLMKLRECLER
ncbi:MAG: sigma-70 family RNA polymerase sigma factor [Pseudomonadota bacterium]